MIGSIGRAAGDPRTIATKNVAVITYPKPNSPYATVIRTCAAEAPRAFPTAGLPPADRSLGNNIQTEANPIADNAPLACHIAAQSPPRANSSATTAADKAIPAPTPAKWTADRADRPLVAKRSMTMAEVQTSTTALAKPPTNRSAKNPPMPQSQPIATVLIVLTANATNTHVRRDPAGGKNASVSAPAM